jgi:hypothetical protein
MLPVAGLAENFAPEDNCGIGANHDNILTNVGCAGFGRRQPQYHVIRSFVIELLLVDIDAAGSKTQTHGVQDLPATRR